MSGMGGAGGAGPAAPADPFQPPALLKHHQKSLGVIILGGDVLVRHTCGSDANGLGSVNCKEQTLGTGRQQELGLGVPEWVCTRVLLRRWH